MKKNLLLLLLFFPLLGYPQLSEETAALYTDFTETAIAETPDAAPVMHREAYRKFVKFCNSASDAELLTIEESAGDLVREYIIKELVERKSSELFALFTKYVADKKVAVVSTNTEVFNWSPSIELYQSVAYQKEKLDRRKYYEKTTEKKLLTDVKQLFGPELETKWTLEEVAAMLAKFDAVAFGSDNTAPELLNFIYRSKDFKVGDRTRVRYFAEKYPTPEILATLANFKNKVDVPFLQQHFDIAYLAVSRFPHPSFLPELKKRLNADFADTAFQEAVTSYCNADSRSLLDTICTKISVKYSEAVRDEKLFSLYGIMEKRNYTFYRPVLAKIDTMLN